MRPIKLCVIFDQRLHSGGGFQQSINDAINVKKLPKNLCEVFFFSTIPDNISLLEKNGIEAEYLEFSVFQKIISILRRITNPFLLRYFRLFAKHSPFEKFLIQKKIDLVYFLSPSELAFDLDEINFFITVWDLCHRDEVEFPEIRANKEFELREIKYKTLLPKATATIVDSDLGKVNVHKRYQVDLDRIYILPFKPSNMIQGCNDSISKKSDFNCINKYDIKFPYIYYPAQLWPHKNHKYILKGLDILIRKYKIKCGAIFSGKDKGNLVYLKNLTHELDLDQYTRFIDFVPDREVVDLYSNAFALVMPSYFGPTNIPPLEAFHMGLPVIYSDRKDFRDHIGDAAIYVDLNNPESLALSIKTLFDDNKFRLSLIKKGYEKLDYLNNYDRLGILENIVIEFRNKRECWDRY